MRYLLFVLIIGIPTSTLAVRGAEPEKKQKTPEELYDTFKGPWYLDDKESLLSGFQLHRYEKSPEPPPAGVTWGVILNFRNLSPETYHGAPAKIEVDGDVLKITLPPAGEDEKRETRTVRIQRKGDKLEVRVLDGTCKGTYELKKVANKQ
jgi:hypothetical protein